MEKSKAYDLPVRIFHWLFALLFIFSFSIAKFMDDESWVYAYHMISGMLMVLLVVLRTIWGIWGSPTARFSSFMLRPAQLADYVRSLFSPQSQRHLGHNPASSYIAIVMMILTLAIGASGLLMVFDVNKHLLEDLHELLANGFLLAVVLHIAGVVFHQIRHSDGMIFSMIDGCKAPVAGETEIASSHRGVGMIFSVIMILAAIFLLKNFDQSTGQLNLWGKSIQLAEKEGSESEENEHGHTYHDEDENEEDDDD